MNRILLLHPEDTVGPRFGQPWRQIIDLGRAPVATYDGWSKLANCKIVSAFDFAQGTDDLHRTRELVEHGMGRVVDRFGVDWWDVLAQSVVPELQQLICLARLGADIDRGADLFCSRPHFLATALQKMLGGNLMVLEPRGRRLIRRAKHYAEAAQRLDSVQLTQVIQDKFDPEHAVRRRLARRLTGSSAPVVLLPSAYVNVSRTAVAFARLSPDSQFVLLHGRQNGRLAALPANVRQASLDGYFSAVDASELKTLANSFVHLRQGLASSAPELDLAEGSGLLESVQNRLSWGLAIRDAWLKVFDSQNISACICADDSNPYSRVPLMIAKQRGLPALACHHGALDSRMAIKKSHADFYLAKSEMERDYLVRVCRIAEEDIVTGGPTRGGEAHTTSSSRDWLVFFTEPYAALGWRPEEIYRDLLPRLVALSKKCGLELVFKLHPFESSAGHKRILRRFLDRNAAEKIRIVTGPISADLWQHIGCALTVQSTVALECSARGIPIFLCGWLADRCCGYVEQFQRFGRGQLLRSPAELDQVPHWICSWSCEASENSATQPLDPEMLRQLLSGTYSRPELATA